MTDLTTVATLEHCSLTTTGRRTHRAHTTEIWFALDGGRVYVLASNGDRSDWLRDLRERPTVGIRIGDHDFVGATSTSETATGSTRRPGYACRDDRNGHASGAAAAARRAAG